ncbi:glycosyltransferase [Sulfurovum sp. NBC37-1]|uniref:glycosyltransferase n=1 Tax=Sulfurovum sp. (strain NBC37-1) TaxID=387093 RepID=UPI000158774C|nr:glycosyltransferase [Sulfurovum sp. NBC37-1]BAF71305.1 glycosyl transferase [Sulfurovum sp. NBC37-1]
MPNPKIAIIHDWYQNKGGAENVISSLLNLYPDADFFALVDFFDDQKRQDVLKGKKVTYTFIQRLPFAKKIFRHYLFLFPLAIERMDLRGYDLIISSSHAIAKGVMTGPEQLHICINYSPMRYAWDMYFDYRKEHNLKGIKEKFLFYVLHKIRIWDVIASNRVDHFIAISRLVQKRIAKYYRRESTIIYPPVDIENYTLCENKQDYYFTMSRLVPYKRVKMIVETFVKNGKPLVVAGTGPQLKEIEQIATDNIRILGYVDDQMVVELMQKARAFLFAAYEDFGIVPVEAMACGTPVIAYGVGGIRDTLIDRKVGLFFDEQNEMSLNNAIDRFETMDFDYVTIANHAAKFSNKRFEKEIKKFVDGKWGEFLKNN